MMADMKDSRVRNALAGARPVPFWLDQPGAMAPAPALHGKDQAALAVIGGGFTGLWTALQAKEADPDRDVVLVEGRRIAGAATGRNGGFCSASLTHGIGNGRERFPAELATLERMGRANLDEIEKTVAAHGIDCDFRRTGELAVATQDWQLAGLRDAADTLAGLGGDAVLLDAGQVRAEVSSPTYAWGLQRACLEAGVRIYEDTPVRSVVPEPGPAGGLELRTPDGTVHARHVAMGTGAFEPLLRRLRHYLVPVYDYALVTEPLSSAQLDSIGWQRRQGVGDSANQFHYYRLTRDNRILWGGYDAVYYFGGKIADSLDQRPATFEVLAQHFFETFPQLQGLSFSHSWGGVIDTCARFCAFFGTAMAGRLAYAAGYTGLGVGASRFGAAVMLDLLSGQPTERTELEMVRTRPLPFPPEPVRAAGINLTRWSLARADERQGRRNLWLRTLDRVGLGFDS
jgi:glycine/D-amino acid oxidase-like deaminating enzyme